MGIWKVQASVEDLDRNAAGTMMQALDIRFKSVGEDSIAATMPVDERTRQPMGLLHGGASVALAEELGRSTFSGVAITALVHTDMASVHLFNTGSDAQKARWMPGVVDGSGLIPRTIQVGFVAAVIALWFFLTLGGHVHLLLLPDPVKVWYAMIQLATSGQLWAAAKVNRTVLRPGSSNRVDLTRAALFYIYRRIAALASGI